VSGCVGDIFWTLAVATTEPRNWSSNEVLLMKEAAERTWAALERARAEAALRESEVLRRVALSGGRMGTWHWDLDAGVCGGDAQFMALWGFPPTDVPRPLTDYTDRMTPEGAAEMAEIVSRAVAAGEEFDGALEIVAGPAAGRWVRWRGRAADVSGRVLDGVTFDITEQKQAEAALREREKRQAFLLRLSDALRPLDNPIEIMTTASALTGPHLGLDRCFYGEVDAASEHAYIENIYCAPGVPPFPQRVRLDDFGEELVANITTGATLAADDILNESRLTDPVQMGRYVAAQIQAFVGVPLVKGGRLVAILSAHQSSARQWTHNDIVLLEEVAERTWAAVERARAEAALRENEERSAFLVRFSDAVRDLSDPMRIANESCRILTDQLRTDRTLWAEIDWTAREYVADWSFLADGTLVEPTRWPFDETLPFAADHLAGRSVAYDDVAVDPRIPDPVRAAMTGRGLLAGIAAPVRVAGRLVAVLSTSQATAPRRWRPEEVAFVEALAQRAWGEIERARAEAALRESEERFRALAEAIEDVFYLTDLDRNALLYLSPAYETIWARPVAALLADLSTFVETIHSEDRPRFLEGKAAQERGEPVMIEYRIVRPDGTLRWLLDRSFPIGADGHGRRSAGIASDVTARKEIEESLRASEARFRQFAEAAPEVVWIRDAATLQWEYLSPAFETIYGLPRDEVLKADNLHRWADLILPEDRDAALEAIERVRQGEQVTFEYRIRRPSDGDVRWLRNTDFPVRDAAGRVERVGGFGQDITALKRADERLRDSERRQRALIEGIPQLVWRAVDGGHWTWASPQWSTFTGLSDEASRGLGWLDALHPDDRDRARKAWHAADGAAHLEVEYRLCHAGEGRHRWFKTRATPVRDEAGGIVEWLGTSTDIDDLRRLQDEQQVLVAELQHRTRNLIAVVRSIAQQTMAATASTEQFRAHFNDRLAALSRVQGLLSRAADDRITIRALLQMELDALGAGEVGERIVLDGPEVALRNSVVQTLALALHELATNARKYGALATGDGRLRVTWCVRHGDEEDRRLALEWVEDGIARQREEESPTRKGYGRELIERALPYSLGARTRFELSDAGERCSIDLPLTRAAGRRDRP
jgi:PAS domain S-box-containing protein